MPTKPSRPCTHAGCHRLAITRGCCAVHQPAKRVDTRPSAARRGYNGEWQRIRHEVLTDEPHCRMCGKPARDVHHIRSVRQGGTHERHNLAPLCVSCHRKVTRAEAVTR